MPTAVLLFGTASLLIGIAFRLIFIEILGRLFKLFIKGIQWVIQILKKD